LRVFAAKGGLKLWFFDEEALEIALQLILLIF